MKEHIYQGTKGFCNYKKGQFGYISECGIRANWNRMWKYCPFCGRRIHMVNTQHTES